MVRESKKKAQDAVKENATVASQASLICHGDECSISLERGEEESEGQVTN